MSLKELCWGSLMPVIFAALLFGLPLRASADVYELVDLGSGSGNDMYGLTSSGGVIVHYYPAGLGLKDTWRLFTKDGGVTFFDTKPELSYDNGSRAACNNSELPFQTSGIYQLCNNGKVVFTYEDHVVLWMAPDPVGGPAPADQAVRIYPYGVSFLALNQEGDIAFATGYENYVAYDLGPAPTPEPSSLLLLTTGALGSAAVLRRRFANGRRI